MPVPTFSTEPEPTSTPWPKPIPRPTSHTSSTTVTIHTSRSTPVTTSSIETTSYSSSHENPPATTTVTITSGPAPSSGSCNTGPVQCCNSVEPASSENASKQLGLLGIVLQDVNIPIGITCNPISVLGLGSSGTCNAQTVCCENNNFNGLINIGCTPINLGL
ncbi:hydrophobin-domain-containing protein [Fomitiporia mediterranea MF3/22]|uniref:hydrophobin-domain-containing protein n=1 Tax=Fomitiporia mediterranea (strain MF3/22) TaxID=694068 RepID=UPI0004407A30|nr:hydrophobin-domain-containing protein [Fomitiporia mediterranea MF3/22]EJD00348.1 hydrophobin-domain-containing protein [Fomitiporia mediterranea MF3/22]